MLKLKSTSEDKILTKTSGNVKDFLPVGILTEFANKLEKNGKDDY